MQNQSLALQLYFGFKSLPPVPREPLAAHRPRPVLREAPAGPSVSVSAVPGPGPGPAGRQQPRGGEPLPTERDLLSPHLKPFGPVFSFFSLWDAVPHFFSTSCSRRNPKSITLSEKCL